MSTGQALLSHNHGQCRTTPRINVNTITANQPCRTSVQVEPDFPAPTFTLNTRTYSLFATAPYRCLGGIDSHFCDRSTVQSRRIDRKTRSLNHVKFVDIKKINETTTMHSRHPLPGRIYHRNRCTNTNISESIRESGI